MIDYLEAGAEESADALLEAELRLAAALAELRGQAGARNMQGLGETAASETDQLPAWDAASPGSSRTPAPEGPSALDPDDPGTLRLPLGEELERLDAALGGGALNQGEQPEGTVRAAGYAPWSGPGTPAGAGTGRPYEPGELADRSGGDQGTGDLSQTEDALRAGQLDRIFRRDSRRYDGGFYLY